MGSVVSFWKSAIRCIHSISAVVDDVSRARAWRSARRSASAVLESPRLFLADLGSLVGAPCLTASPVLAWSRDSSRSEPG